MLKTILIKNGQLVNRGTIEVADILIKNGHIERIDKQIDVKADIAINAEGKYILPGIIDDQVHFREPGLTHKATIGSEARAAVAGGVTSFMEMPNTNPPALTSELLEQKYDIAARTSLANYSFFMGGSNDNLDNVLKINYKNVCGIKLFMGSSTGNMLVDNPNTLEAIFKNAPTLVATHCEDEATVRKNTQAFKEQYGENCPPQYHPIIRSHEACYLSSSFAVGLAKRFNTRLHILHLTTAEELNLFDNTQPLQNKRITSEVCVHHLFFNDQDYLTLGNKIKCNPAIKTVADQNALFEALLDNRLDIIATDHAPHTREEKAKPYFDAPSGLPLVQHALQLMLTFYHKGKISLPRIVEKMCHAPAVCFEMEGRGYLDEGAWADIVIVDLEKTQLVAPENIYYKCGWSPLEGQLLRGCVETTIVSGHLAFHQGQFDESKRGERLTFAR